MAKETVTVACKLPNGLQLRIFKMVPSREPVLGGGTREVEKAEQIGGVVHINGNAVEIGKSPKFPITDGGYALTHNVDAEFFTTWLEQNADHDAVRNGLIFGTPKQDTIEKRSREGEKLRSGLEPIDPDKLPRGIQKGTKEAA